MARRIGAHWLFLYARRVLRGPTARLLVLVLVAGCFLEVLRVQHSIARGEALRRRRWASDDPNGGPEENQQHQQHQQHQQQPRVYIASMHWNNGAILGGYWNDAVLALADALGRDRVFVSVYESGSWDDSKEKLRRLDAELAARGVARRVEVSDVTHLDEMSAADKGEGWVDTARGGRELRRIPYLARLRNRTIRDLVELARAGTMFDKVLFLNDVIFTTEDVLTLMDTNGGEYAAACSLDFSKPPQYYDTFALRDDRGDAHLMQTWPFFRSKGSRRAMVRHDVVPVTSCWNGIVVMQAEPFVSSTGLRFRGVPDSLAAHHLEASECCLIHADNPLSRTAGVFVNPRVRVGYNPEAYALTHPGAGTWVPAWDIFRGLWASRIRRWTAALTLEGWIVRRRVARWEAEAEGNREPGEFCLVNEMQVIVENGWAHV
ncbi:hypothetical protein ESCO_004710 [Escovopsis weberi]|uniref:Uncharacterized protein n=1 Tax=Escovopsis weberi TaxID=150374 RepID=A0A0M9VRK0_ESCWE|nr:hypothetical protein ESCO_004710 [Escovopsis weberi]